MKPARREYNRANRRRLELNEAIRLAYRQQQISYTDRCILLNEVEHLFNRMMS